jgi:hypothetical protein
MRADRLVRSKPTRAAAVVVLSTAALLAAWSIPGGALGRPAAHAARVCTMPRLTHLTLELARRQAARAGCALTVKGALVKQATVQTVQRQSPVAGRHASRATIWLNPLCFGEADHGPAISEPRVTPGPTELISGFYLDGGPLRRFSSPGCHRPEQPPGGGTVEVIAPATGALVAKQSSGPGMFVEIPLPPGSYKLIGTFGNATINGQHPTESRSVEIPPGHTVRQDFVLPIP